MCNNFESVVQQVSNNKQRLNIAEYAVPSTALKDLTIDSFTKEYQARFPNSILFREFDVKFQQPKNYSTTNLYYSSKISYVLEESFTCAGKPYNKPKKNTYTLCPICDPFGPRASKQHFEKREGKQIEFNSNEPRFYDTLHSRFDHHMNHVHGVFKDSTKISSPSFVLTKDETNNYQLNSFCPFAKRDKMYACCWMNKINLNSSDNPLKSYMRHYTTFHKKNGSKLTEGEFYVSRSGKVLYPINYSEFSQVVHRLLNEVANPPNIFFEEIGIKIETTEGLLPSLDFDILSPPLEAFEYKNLPSRKAKAFTNNHKVTKPQHSIKPIIQDKIISLPHLVEQVFDISYTPQQDVADSVAYNFTEFLEQTQHVDGVQIVPEIIERDQEVDFEEFFNFLEASL